MAAALCCSRGTRSLLGTPGTSCLNLLPKYAVIQPAEMLEDHGLLQNKWLWMPKSLPFLCHVFNQAEGVRKSSADYVVFLSFGSSPVLQNLACSCLRLCIVVMCSHATAECQCVSHNGVNNALARLALQADAVVVQIVLHLWQLLVISKQLYRQFPAELCMLAVRPHSTGNTLSGQQPIKASPKEAKVQLAIVPTLVQPLWTVSDGLATLLLMTLLLKVLATTVKPSVYLSTLIDIGHHGPAYLTILAENPFLTHGGS